MKMRVENYLMGVLNMDETYFMVCGSFMYLRSIHQTTLTTNSLAKKSSQPTADDGASTTSDWLETASSNTTYQTHLLITDMLVFALNIKIVAIVVEHTTLVFRSCPHSL